MQCVTNEIPLGCSSLLLPDRTVISVQTLKVPQPFALGETTRMGWPLQQPDTPLGRFYCIVVHFPLPLAAAHLVTDAEALLLATILFQPIQRVWGSVKQSLCSGTSLLHDRPTHRGRSGSARVQVQGGKGGGQQPTSIRLTSVVNRVRGSWSSLDSCIDQQKQMAVS
jgi:hypothetical protein